MCKLLAIVFLAAAASASPVHLRCEYLDNPIGIDSPQPHFSWESDSAERNWRQSAYRILVSSTPEGARTGKADVWDSGKRTSDDSNGITYGGPPLQSRRRYYWTVSVWDNKGRMTQAARRGGKWGCRRNPTGVRNGSPGKIPRRTPTGPRCTGSGCRGRTLPRRAALKWPSSVWTSMCRPRRRMPRSTCLSKVAS